MAAAWILGDQLDQCFIQKLSTPTSTFTWPTISQLQRLGKTSNKANAKVPLAEEARAKIIITYSLSLQETS